MLFFLPFFCLVTSPSCFVRRTSTGLQTLEKILPYKQTEHGTPSPLTVSSCRSQPSSLSLCGAPPPPPFLLCLKKPCTWSLPGYRCWSRYCLTGKLNTASPSPYPLPLSNHSHPRFLCPVPPPPLPFLLCLKNLHLVTAWLQMLEKCLTGTPFPLSPPLSV